MIASRVEAQGVRGAVATLYEDFPVVDLAAAEIGSRHSLCDLEARRRGQYYSCLMSGWKWATQEKGIQWANNSREVVVLNAEGNCHRARPRIRGQIAVPAR